MSSRIPGRELRIGNGGSVQFGEQGKTPVSILLMGANPGAEPAGRNLLAGRSNYILGNDPTRWRTKVSQFGRVQVPAVYPGIDLVYYGNGDQLEHDYLVAPNADLGRIRMQFRGAKPHLDVETGELVLREPEIFAAAIRMERPVAYQLSEDGTRTGVAASYTLSADGEAQFILGNYDHARPLVIDPVILYGTYFGGNRNDSIFDLKLGSDGSIFLLITGDSTDLKTVGAPANVCNGTCGPTNPGNGNVEPDMYVAKLDSTGQTLLFATYLGGSDDDEGLNLALDTDGSVYVAGFSHSQDFPVINGYPGGAPAAAGTPAGTLSKLSADGSTLLYSTFIGFGQPAIDSVVQVSSGTAPIMVTANNGIVYLIGIATIDQTGTDFLWKTNPLFTAGNDFLAKLDTTKSGTASIVYATQVGDSIGGFNYAQLSSLALDSKGDVWLYGQTSDAAFPATTAGALQPQCKSTPCSASFLMEIDPSGTSAPYATYLGGSTAGGTVTPRDIAIDSSDNIYVSGSTSQSDFPILNGAFTTFASINNGGGYASKLSPDGTTLLYSTFVQGTEIAVSSSGQLAFTGSYGPGLTLKNNLQTTPPPSTGTDAIFGLIDTTQSGANSLLISSYLGTNTGYTTSNRVTIAGTGQILIAGWTTATDVPVVNAYQAACASCASRTGADGFVAAIQPNDTLTLNPATLAFPSTGVGSTSAAMTATLYNGTTKSIYLTQPTLTDSTDFTQSDNCNGILSPLTGCTVTFTFTPQSTGTLTSTYSIGDLDDPSTSLTIALSGTATGASQSETLSPASLDFGTVIVGQTATQTVTFYNNGPSAATIYNNSNTNAAFSAVGSTCAPTVAANASCTFTLQFAPTVAGPQTSTFEIVDRSSNPTVALTGTTYIVSPQITLTPNPLNFHNAIQGEITQLAFTLTNSSTFPITFPYTAPTLNDPSSAFSFPYGFGSGYCSYDYTGIVTVAAGTSCLFPVYFKGNIAPDTTASATLTIPYSPPGTTTLYAMTGNMTANEITPAAAVVAPTTIQFPATANGKTSTAQIVNVSNSGEQPLSFTSATLTGANPTAFSTANNCPAALNKNDACKISVSFTPDATGNEFTATLDVKLSTGDVNVVLNGGTTPSDFVLSTTAPKQSNPNATWTLNIAPLTAGIGFNEPITFNVTGLDASYGTPVFTPSTVTPNEAMVTTKLTLGNSNIAALRRGTRSTLPLFACCMAFLLSSRKRLKTYRSRIAAMIAVLAFAVFTLSACAKSPVNFTVTATSGTISHELTLTLQP